MLCRHKLFEAAIPCLQCIVRTRFTAEHPIENVPMGNVKFWFDASFPSTGTNIGVFKLVSPIDSEIALRDPFFGEPQKRK